MTFQNTSRPLQEGIVHVEDLDIQEFMRVISAVSTMQATEKLDGAQLWFGIDENGKLYTSRAGKSKSAENVYEEKDYPFLSSSNGFRSAHAALKSKEEEIKKVLRPGDTVEIEVLYGRQPNAVTYGSGGKNYIAFLRGIGDTPDILVDQLANSLNGVSTTVRVQTVETTDGETLKLVPTDVLYQFVGVQKIDTAKLKTTDVSKQLASLKKFLDAKAGLKGNDISNFDLITSSLGSFDKTVRPAAKELKERVLAKVMTDFKLPIKKELLDKFVSQVKSPLSATDLSAEEDIGIEGVVLKDIESGNQIKIVDKDTFTTINKFNQSVRSGISGIVKTTDSSASLESQGGIIGKLRILIADLLGNKDLARTAAAKKIFATMKGKTPSDTVKNVSKELSGNDDYRGTKRKIEALIDNTKQQLAQELKDFKTNKDAFQLKLKNGKSIGLSPEIIRRTLLSFAEAKRDLDELAEKLAKTKNLAQLVALLYGKIAKAVHEVAEPEPVSESLLLEKRMTTDVAQYAGKDAFTLLNIYFATYMMAAVLVKNSDMPGIRLLRDKTHMRLARWNKEMSPLNFWGYAVWRAGTPAVKKLIGAKTAAEIFRHARKVLPSLWKFLHIDMSFGKEVPIEWAEHRRALEILMHVPGMRIDRINTLINGIFRYDDLTFDEKVKFHSKLYYYVQQFIPTSPLAHRLRVINDKLLLNANGQNDLMVQEMKLMQQVTSITEDGDAPASDTNAGAVAGYAQPLFGEKKIIIKMKRNPNIQRFKFARPKTGKKNG